MDTKENLTYKKEVLEQFNTAVTRIYENNEDIKLTQLWTIDTIYYFEQFDEIIIEHLKDYIEDLKLENHENLEDYQNLLTKFCNEDLNEHDHRTTCWLLEEYQNYVDNVLKEDIKELEEELTEI